MVTFYMTPSEMKSTETVNYKSKSNLHRFPHGFMDSLTMTLHMHIIAHTLIASFYFLSKQSGHTRIHMQSVCIP